jgi:hypothetical protein
MVEFSNFSPMFLALSITNLKGFEPFCARLRNSVILFPTLSLSVLMSLLENSSAALSLIHIETESRIPSAANSLIDLKFPSMKQSSKVNFRITVELL